MNWQVGGLPHEIEAGRQGCRCSQGLRSWGRGGLVGCWCGLWESVDSRLVGRGAGGPGALGGWRGCWLAVSGQGVGGLSEADRKIRSPLGRRSRGVIKSG